MEPNFWKDKPKAEKILKEKKLYEDLVNSYKVSLKQFDEISDLYDLAVEENNQSIIKESENDLVQSLSLVPDEPYVLNYLAYSWLERNINLEKSIEMLEVAFSQKRGDPYIIDSLGWGMYLTGRYEEAEKLLQKAVKLMPLDPIVNDHYADILWKLNKNLQANYFWNYVLNLETTENEMKDKIKKKLILGIRNHS